MNTHRHDPMPLLDDEVFVLTVRRSFWETTLSRRMFPHTLYAGGLGSDLVWWRNAWLLARALPRLIFRRPKVVIVGQAHYVAKWLLWLRHRGLFRGFKLVVHQMARFWTGLAVYADRVIVYSSKEAEVFSAEAGVGDVFEFVPLPADGDFTGVKSMQSDIPYVFAGGYARRDFISAIQAVRGLPAVLRIRCADPAAISKRVDLPGNVVVGGPVSERDFLSEMAGAFCILVPLERSPLPHGHTTIVQALRLGKPVITTREASVEDYVSDGKTGILVEAGDVDGYRAAIRRLLEDADERERLSAAAKEASQQFTYERYADRLREICQELLNRSAIAEHGGK